MRKSIIFPAPFWMSRSHCCLLTVFAVLWCCLSAISGTLEEAIRSVYDSSSADSLKAILVKAHQARLPAAPLENKIREGMVKKRTASEIFEAVKFRESCLERIKKEHGASIPENYTAALFALEKAHYGVKDERGSDRPSSVLPRKDREVGLEQDKERTMPAGQPGAVKNASPSAAAGQRIYGNKVIDSGSALEKVKRGTGKKGDAAIKQQEQEERNEKMMEKTLKKADAKERALEKRMDKMEQGKQWN